MLQPDRSPRPAPGPAYPWVVVGLLWFCGFFNYADRMALSAVVPLLKTEFALTDGQVGWVASSFMLVYALTSPFTGYSVDLLSRRLLIASGLAFWSLICAATAMARSFLQLVFYRAAEGLGEAFYFPASMSMLADYHGPRTRSRAMSIHQTSVYLGTAGGWFLGGELADLAGWQAPFWSLGLVGLLYALFLGVVLVEPPRGQAADGEAGGPGRAGERDEPPAGEATAPLGDKVAVVLRSPAAVLLLLVFIGANFVAAAFLTWLPSMVGRGLNLGLSDSAVTSTLWPIASVPGAALGGWLADRAARRSAGGRIYTQCLGLFLAAPFVLLAGWSTTSLPLMVGLVGAGLCKGIYDANIFASLYDVIPVADRGTAAGLMNSVGWTGGFLAPIVIGGASDRFGLGAAIASTAVVYMLVAALAFLAGNLAARRLAIRS